MTEAFVDGVAYMTEVFVDEYGFAFEVETSAAPPDTFALPSWDVNSATPKVTLHQLGPRFAVNVLPRPTVSSELLRLSAMRKKGRRR